MEVRLSERAKDDLANLPARIADQALRKIERLRGGLVGNIKALQGARAGYRLRSGDYRILFDVKSDLILIERVRHRREAYD